MAGAAGMWVMWQQMMLMLVLVSVVSSHRKIEFPFL
jgi:hypothetical protein